MERLRWAASILPVWFGWHNVKIFALPCARRNKHYVRVTNWLVPLEPLCALLVPQVVDLRDSFMFYNFGIGRVLLVLQEVESRFELAPGQRLSDGLLSHAYLTGSLARYWFVTTKVLL